MLEASTYERPHILLIGPYDPTCGEYTFLAPPLGVWRLAGVLLASGFQTEVFDPNICTGPPQLELERTLRRLPWDLIGVSTTGMTLRFDLELAHLAHRFAPSALMIAGGMEATFRPDLMFALGPFDRVILGEGERPLCELARRMRAGADLRAVPGTIERLSDGTMLRLPQAALNQRELGDAISHTPYEAMPYRAYWDRLERVYAVGGLPSKAAREARLAEIRSVRLITLNYCPMACSFCSATNFLHEAQDSVATVARLDSEECMRMLRRIVAAHPDVRTIIFQDDIFAFTRDRRILPLCEAIVAAKAAGELPGGLQFISTNRIDAMSHERLTAMRRAGFRVLGFGIESFSRAVLQEFNKAQIHPHIGPMLRTALDLGITPFLDLILASPLGRVEHLAETLRQANYWLQQGCEVGMYPYVIPFSGAAFARDPKLQPHMSYTRQQVAGTAIEWQQPSKILPLDPQARGAILRIEAEFQDRLVELQDRAGHLPSRVRSLIWIACAQPVMAQAGYGIGDTYKLRDLLRASTPPKHPPLSVAAPAYA
jgi:radical SAM superfamily enzyme YgiQ (UPF0313 family)